MTKTEAEQTKKIEIWWLLRNVKTGTWIDKTISWSIEWGEIGCEVNLNNEMPFVRFHYNTTNTWTGEKTSVDHKVFLQKTPCNLGGFRYWFICNIFTNGKYCGRRVGVLYKDGVYFACRHCYRLTYASRNIPKNYRNHPFLRDISLESRAKKIGQKIKRKKYAGRTTKNQQKLDDILSEMDRLPTYSMSEILQKRRKK